MEATYISLIPLNPRRFLFGKELLNVKKEKSKEKKEREF